MQRADLWPPERDARMIELRNAGLYAREIGEELGVTKNAVIGRWGRLKMAKTRSEAAKEFGEKARKRPPQQRRRRERAQVAGPEVKPQRREAVPPLPPLMIGVLNLKPKQCRWPCAIEVPGRHLFCGQPATHGSYCDHHHRRSIMTRAERITEKREWLVRNGKAA